VLNTGKNLAVALVSAGILAFFAVLFDAYAEEIKAAPVLYQSIWYVLLAGSSLLFVSASIAAALSSTSNRGR
jgi:hypothetical protein